MNKSYKQIYNEIVGEKFNMVVIRYDPQKKKYEYRALSHTVENDALDKVVELIIDDMVFYAFSEKEILKLNMDMGILKDMRGAAKYAYIERLPKRTYSKTDGIVGEVLLDILIQLDSLDTKKLVARAKHTEITSKKEITGYDALYFTIDNGEICLWLGQAKAGQKGYCKKNILIDLQEKYKKEYFADTAFYIADKNEAEELEELLLEINKICFNAQIGKWKNEQKVDKLLALLKNKKVKIKIPCLITYTKDIYGDATNLKKYIMNEIKDIINEFDVKKFPIEIGLQYEIVFYVMPVKDIDYIREKIVKLKREAV